MATSPVGDLERSFPRGHARPGEAIPALAGMSGCGKTMALHRLKSETDGTIIDTAVAGDTRTVLLIDTIMQTFDMVNANNRRALQDRQRPGETIGFRGTRMTDEAQHVVQRHPRGPDNLKSIESLRPFAEEACVEIVLCGYLRLLDTIQKLP